MVLRGRIEHPPYLVLEEEKNFKFNIDKFINLLRIVKTIFFFKKLTMIDRRKDIFLPIRDICISVRTTMS